MRVEFTIPKPVAPPLHTYREEMNYAVLFGDRSGVMAIFRDEDKANIFAGAWALANPGYKPAPVVVRMPE